MLVHRPFLPDAAPTFLTTPLAAAAPRPDGREAAQALYFEPTGCRRATDATLVTGGSLNNVRAPSKGLRTPDR
jgi:hypothetical protein